MIDDLSGLPVTFGGKGLAFDMGTDHCLRALVLRSLLPADQEPLKPLP